MDIVGLIYNEYKGTKTSEEKMGFPMYYLDVDNNGNGLIGIPDSYNVMTDHYVTITGAIKDYQSGQTWLRIQSWGEEYYLLYSDFVEYNRTFACNEAKGNIIIVN